MSSGEVSGKSGGDTEVSESRAEQATPRPRTVSPPAASKPAPPGDQPPPAPPPLPDGLTAADIKEQTKKGPKAEGSGSGSTSGSSGSGDDDKEKIVKPRFNLLTVGDSKIWEELISKELKGLTLVSDFHINPYTKMHSLSAKPNSKYEKGDDEKDDTFLKLISRAQSEPTKKFTVPQTESQMVGWYHQETMPEVVAKKQNRLVDFPRTETELTKYYEVASRQKYAARTFGAPPKDKIKSTKGKVKAKSKTKVQTPSPTQSPGEDT